MAEGTTTRRGFFRRVAAGTGVAAIAATPWGYLLAQQKRRGPSALPPPGALDGDNFAATCIKCGQCVDACPFDTLKLATVGDEAPLGTPFFTARDVPCYMCANIPCVEACPTGALDAGLTDISKARMGLAVLIDQENCLSFRGLRCEICYRDCPAQGRAITVENRPRQISKHAIFVPVVHSEGCTGCGVCEKVCPLPRAAIKVLPRELAIAAPGEHYQFSHGDQPQAGPAAEPSAPEPDAGLDYLNEGEL